MTEYELNDITRPPLVVKIQCSSFIQYVPVLGSILRLLDRSSHGALTFGGLIILLTSQ